MSDQLIGAAPDGPPVIFDAGTETFAKDVLEASREVPVIVDFWAPWCGPCKQLTPVIEKAVTAAKGAVRLAKVNIDENQMIAQQMQIQSIPAVFAFFQGRPIDGFMGAQPESEINAFIDRVLKAAGGAAGPDIDAILDAADEAFNAGDLNSAAGAYAEIARSEPEHVRAISGLARCHAAAGNMDKAQEMLDLVPEAKRNDQAYVSAKAAIDLAAHDADDGEIAALRTKAAAAPDDLQAQHDLAEALMAGAGAEEAADILLNIIRADRSWNDDAARKTLLKLFDARGPKDELTLKARRSLSSILFS